MQIAKGRDAADAANTISVYLLVVRLPSVTTDVLLTFNAPIAIAASSQCAAHVQRLASVEENDAVLARALQSFALKSMSIFGQ